MAQSERANYEKADKPKKVPFVGAKTQAESEFKSPYWGLSYDFPYNPDPLCSGNNYDIYDEMVDDDQVKSAISVKKDMVVNTGWKITGENEEVNAYVTECFDHINESTGLDSSLDDVLRDMLSAYEYGFSITEPVYTLENGKYKYKNIRTRAPHAFKFIMDDFGTVTEVTQAGAKQEHRFKPSQFIHHIYQMQFGNPYGKSDLRAAYKAWKAKQFFIKFFAIYVERYATGTMVGKYPKNYTAGEVTEFHNIIKSIQNATAIAMPDDAVIDIIETGRDASDIYLKGIDYYNMQIARSILVPDLLGISGAATKGGSYALGKEQFSVFLGTIKKDRESLAKKITQKLVRPLVLANFGDIKCEFEFLPYSKADILEYLKLWIEAIKSMAYQPTEEELNYFRSVIGFPEAKKEAVAPIRKPGNKEPMTDLEEEGYISKHREYTKYELKIDFPKTQEYLNKQENKAVKKWGSLGRDVYNSIVEQIRDKGIISDFRPEKINAINPKYAKPMQIEIRNYMSDLYRDTIEQTQKETFPQDKKKYAVALLPDDFVSVLEAESFKMVGDYSVLMTKRAKNILVDAVKNSIGETAALKLIREEMQSESDRWIQSVVRTKTTEIYNEARKSYWETDELASQIVVAYQWSAILDDRTSEICRYLDEKIFDIGEISGVLKPPAHMNCRSLLVPITKFEEYEPNSNSDFNMEKLIGKGGGLLKDYIKH